MSYAICRLLDQIEELTHERDRLAAERDTLGARLAIADKGWADAVVERDRLRELVGTAKGVLMALDDAIHDGSVESMPFGVHAALVLFGEQLVEFEALAGEAG